MLATSISSSILLLGNAERNISIIEVDVSMLPIATINVQGIISSLVSNGGQLSHYKICTDVHLIPSQASQYPQEITIINNRTTSELLQHI